MLDIYVDNWKLFDSIHAESIPIPLENSGTNSDSSGEKVKRLRSLARNDKYHKSTSNGGMCFLSRFIGCRAPDTSVRWYRVALVKGPQWSSTYSTTHVWKRASMKKTIVPTSTRRQSLKSSATVSNHVICVLLLLLLVTCSLYMRSDRHLITYRWSYAPFFHPCGIPGQITQVDPKLFTMTRVGKFKPAAGFIHNHILEYAL